MMEGKSVRRSIEGISDDIISHAVTGFWLSKFVVYQSGSDTQELYLTSYSIYMYIIGLDNRIGDPKTQDRSDKRKLTTIIFSNGQPLSPVKKNFSLVFTVVSLNSNKKMLVYELLWMLALIRK